MDSACPTCGGSVRETSAAESSLFADAFTAPTTLTFEHTVLGQIKAEFDDMRSAWWPPAPRRYQLSSHCPSAAGYGRP